MATGRVSQSRISGKSGNEIEMIGVPFRNESEAVVSSVELDFHFSWKGVVESFRLSALRLALAKRTRPKAKDPMSQLIDSDHIFLDEDLADKEVVLDFVSNKAEKLGICTSAKALRTDLEKREGEISTGLQDGFAIPHAKSAHVLEPSVLFLRTIAPIAWETLDGSDVRCIFALLVPESDAGSTHLRLISKLATNLLEKKFKEHLALADDPKELCDYILASIS